MHAQHMYKPSLLYQPIGREVFGENFLMKILRNNPGTTAGPVGRDERKNTRTSLTYNMAFRF